MNENLKRLIHLSLSADGVQLRTGSLNDIQYVICPVISKLGDNVEWPINAPTPELIPSSVLALSTSDRNNRPVTLGHPRDEYGNYISANSPEILEKLCFGFTFGAKFEDGRVKQEMWLDPIRAAKVGPDASRVIERLQLGEMVEVSEGDYILSEIEEGEWNGKKYGARWIACWADHLAALREGEIGACSIEDGCGALRASAGIKSYMTYVDIKVSALNQARKPTYTGTETTPWTKPTFADYIKYLFNGDEAPISISKCSSDLLRRIASHSLLGDPDATNFQDLTFYPVVNPSTGYLNEKALRGVLAGRGSNGLSKSTLASTQDMATRLLNSEFSANIPAKTAKTAKTDENEDPGESEMEVSEMDMDKIQKKESFFKRLISSMAESIRTSMSNNDLRWKLYKAIEKLDPSISFIHDEDVEAKTVLYCCVIRLGDYWSDNESEYHNYQRTWTIDDRQNVTVNDDAIEVEFYQGWKTVGEPTPLSVVEVVAAASNGQNTDTPAPCGCHRQEGEQSMKDRASVINRLSASGGPFAGNRAALEAMNDKGLGEIDKAFPVGAATDSNQPAIPPTPSPTVTPTTPTPSTTHTAPSGDAVTQQTVSISHNEYTKILAASNAFQAQQEAYKAALVTSLSTVQSSFTPVDLQAMEMSTLEKMAEAFKVNQPIASSTPTPSYIGLPIPAGINKPAMRDLPDPLGLKAHGLRPDGQITSQTAN